MFTYGKRKMFSDLVVRMADIGRSVNIKILYIERRKELGFCLLPLVFHLLPFFS